MGGRTNVQGDAEFVDKAEAQYVIFFLLVRVVHGIVGSCQQVLILR